MSLQITASFTADPLVRPLKFWSERLDIPLDCKFSVHNQVIQQLLDPISATSQNVDANVLLVRPRDIAAEAPESAEAALKSACSAIAANLSAKTLIVLCPHPESTQVDGEREQELATYLGALPNIDAHAIESWPLVELPDVVFDAVSERVGQVPYTEAMFCALGTAIVRHLHRERRAPHKVIAVDADNTLWLGVVGEDGVLGIRVDESRRRLQEFLLEKRRQGYLLAVSSKNEAVDVAYALDQHPDMVLKRSDFTMLKVNWQPKSENLRELAKDLGVGIDSIIFLDDNPAEVGEVAASCPAITALTVPLELGPLEQILQRCWVFDVGAVTVEDEQRAASYAAQGHRSELRDRSASFVDFLKGLKLDVRIAAPNETDLARVAQLTSRTNQFNACKRVMGEIEVRQVIQSADQRCHAVWVRDRFGDYGLVGAMITQTDDDTLLASTFLLSCRALGKGVERAMIRELGKCARELKLGRVAVAFEDADRNGVCAHFLQSIGAERHGDRFVVRAADARELAQFPAEDLAVPTAVEVVDTTGSTFTSALMAQIMDEWGDPNKLAQVLAAERRPRPDLPEIAIPASTATEKRLVAIWEAVLGLEGIGAVDSFVALGGRSLNLVQVHARLLNDFEVEIPLTDLFELPTIRALARRLDGDETDAESVSGRLLKKRESGEPIAIVGMALRVPGADSVEQFWQNLCDGVESIQRFTDEELASAGVDVAEVRQDPTYVPAKGCMADIDQFDAAFFGILPKEAKMMDPQQRIFLELAWEALERAGYNPDTYEGRIGLWAGAYFDTYMVANLLTDKAFHADWIPSIQVGSLQTELGNDKDYLATRVSFKLNLRGPSMTVQTACSTSMVAISQAIQSLRAGESDMAMAGGVTITLPEKKGYYFTEDGMLSRDGRVCTFSDEASGTVFGNGTGIVVMKRLSEALADGDHIHGVIRGAALNNDGGVKHSYTAPSVDGQVDVIAMAHQDAGIDARSVSYIEAHGTGTPLGDPIEVAALSKLFQRKTGDKQFCALGSLKPNVGHLDVASGVCGVIKTALSLEHRSLPPLLHFKNPNPKIDFANSPFYVNDGLTEWTPSGDFPRRAGVSSFGVGGTNGHVVLEETPEREPSDVSKRPAQLMLLSARTDKALDAATQRLADWATQSDANLADAAYTLAIGRKTFAKRRAIAVSDLAQLSEQWTQGKTKSGSPRRTGPPVSFLFPGQGAQHVGMARELYASEKVFREHVDFCADTLADLIGGDLREVLYPDAIDESATNRLKQTLNAQPAIFVIETGLAKLWQSWGVRPERMIGHSVGEFAAACVAEVFSLKDGLKILAERGRLMGDLPGGAMLSVRLSEAAIQSYLTEADLGAVNGKELCVLAGSHEVIAKVEAQLKADGVTTKHLDTSHGFHSEMMDPVIDPFTEVIAQATLQAPKIPILSTVTCEWLTEAQATDPAYWAKHLRQPVRFFQAVRSLAAEEDGQLMLEVGPGQTLATLARQSIGREGEHQFFATCKHAASEGSDFQQLLETTGQLWCHGAEIDWQAFYAGENRRRVVLPTYPFERKRHWVDPVPMDASAAAPTTALPITSTDITPHIMPDIPKPPPRSERIAAAMRESLSELSDIPEEELDGSASFLELGFDSLLLTQVSKAFQDTFSVKITMRQLLDELPSIDALVAHLDQTMDPSVFAPEDVEMTTPVAPAAAAEPMPATSIAQVGAAQTVAAAPAPVVVGQAMMMASAPVALGSDVSNLISQQMTLMQQQLALLQGGVVQPAMAPAAMPALKQAPSAPVMATPQAVAAATNVAPAKASEPGQAAHGPYKPLNRTKDTGLSLKQQQFIDELTKRYNAKTKTSKERTQKYRHCFADPRTANGFNRLWKDMCYQILVERAKGSRLYDIDGNEYIDIVNGFGPNFLGHSPDFILEALHEQLDKTIAVGPQAEFAGETAELVCELIGMDRVCFLNTGSEAVQAAMRVARTITGRDKIIVFEKDYHGNFDEVLVRGANRNGKFKSMPIAPGIPRRAVEDILVLPYGTDESLEIIRQQASTCAAVMVEPMQSRRPDFQPAAFIKELRKITEQTGCLFVFDEVITGFRTGPGGAQEHYGIKADLATYGKVIGSGMPVGLIAGKREYMDTFDGGQWQYGDDSFPEAPVTFFAGTFVRHPLAVAAVNATAKFFKAQPRSFWDKVYDNAKRLAGTIDGYFQEHGVGMRMAQFSSQMYVKVADDEKYAGLFFCLMRDKGVFMLEGLPNYLTASHTDEDIDYVIQAAKESVAEMMAAGFFEDSGLSDSFSLGKLQGPSRRMETALLAAPVTAAQQEIWLACNLDPQASCAYNEATTLTMDGPVDLGYLKAALNEIIERHDALRARFGKDGDQVHFAESLHLELPEHVLSGLEPHEQQDRLAEFKTKEATTPLDLATGPLVRGFVVKLAEEKHILFLTAHHIVCDGWSYNVLLEELSALYGAKCRNEPPDLPSVVPFSKYANTRAKKQSAAAENTALEFWLNEYATCPKPISLPTDRPFPAQPTFAGSTERHTVAPEVLKTFKRVGAKQKCTAYQALLGAFEVLLHKLSGQADFVIGTPAAGQTIEEESDIIGHCVNFLPLRAKVDSEQSFNEHLAGVRHRVMNAFDHQDFTYGELLPKLKLPRLPGRMPLVEIEFNVERTDYHDEFHGLKTDFDSVPKRFVNFPIFINIVDGPQGLIIDCDYKTDLFDAHTIRRWLASFEQVLVELSQRPEQSIAELSILSESEQRTLLHDWNGTEESFKAPGCLHQLVEQRAASHPDAIAVSQGERKLSYRELDEQANAIAARLQEVGAGPDQLVGVFLERDPNMAAALLGVLKSGSAYVPLDPGFPTERLAMMIEDASPLAILTTPDLRSRLPDASSTLIDVADERRAEPVSNSTTESHLAYVIYTSGSTGKPKGVQIEHRAVVNFLNSMCSAPGISERDVLVAVTTLCFDISVLEFFLPLISGARVEVATRDQAINPEELAELISQCGATHMQATPVTWRMLSEYGWTPPNGFRMLCGGEPLPLDLAQTLAQPGVELWNLYGPTETTIWSTITRVETNASLIHIGRPIANTSIYILDEEMRLVPTGVPGRLFIGGHGLARGYANRAELTAEKFVSHPFESKLSSLIYDTGDLARYRSDGTIECLGRSDNQIKFNGYRIELGDIETAMRMYPSVSDTAVKMVEEAGNQQLLGYVISDASLPFDAGSLREYLKAKLPGYMVPGHIQQLAAFPLTPNRKVDRKALPDLVADGKAEPVVAAAPASKMSGALVAEVSEIWKDLLDTRSVSTSENFFDVGGHSLLLLRLLNRLKQTFKVSIKLGDLFRYTTIEAQARLCASASESLGGVAPVMDPTSPVPVSSQDVAVVGMSGRFPGAAGLDAFWENIRNGVESIVDLTEEQLVDAGVPKALRNDPNYVRKGGLIDHAESFDQQLFGISPREVELMDPQHRVFLEEAYKTLESAGYDAERYAGRIGVFAGAGDTLMKEPEALLPSDYYPALTGRQPDYLTTRVAYRLNLRGPSLTIQTGCSTSLVAVQIACQNLLSGQCDMALAGGVSLSLPQGEGYLYQEGMMLAPDGHCRAFDEQASGTVFTQGVGVVALKPLKAALEDGDEIHAVIKAAAINNDGGEKVGFTAPSIEGQSQVILNALEQQAISPESISLVETHGTGTPLGDPIEFAALREVYQAKTSKTGFCALGALKNNVGHMDAAAGIGSFIKAVLALKHRELPPTINYQAPNPELEIESSPFYVSTECRDWVAADSPRRAAVSSFGIGGTNAHVILEEAPAVERAVPAEVSNPLLVYSGKSTEALEATLESGLAYLEAHPELPVADAAYTLQVGRREFRYRAAAVNGKVVRGEAATRQVVFLFPGQGSSYHRMAQGLYESSDLFRATVDQCDSLIESVLGWRLSVDLFSDDTSIDWTRTDRAQPALFVVEYALAKVWQQWGLEPSAMIGHSLGEYVAACLAEVFTLPDALTLVCERGRLMQGMATGAMLSVSASRAQVDEILQTFGEHQLGLAVENSPQSQVVSGPDELIARFSDVLDGQEIMNRRLKTSHAFHSSMMDDAAASFETVFSKVTAHPPQRPLVSNVTGDWITAEQAIDGHYWSQHLRSTVKFSSSVERVAQELESPLFLEMGPGMTLSTLVRQHDSTYVTVSSMRHAQRSDLGDEETLRLAVGSLWTQGVAFDWPEVFDHRASKRVPLPGYAFQRQWFDWAGQSSGATKLGDQKTGLLEVLWKKRILPKDTTTTDESWVIFDDTSDSLSKVAVHANANAITIHCGDDWKPRLQGLSGRVRVVFGWALDERLAEGDYDAFQTECVDQLVDLVRLLDGLSLISVNLTVVTRELFDIGGTEGSRSEMASLIGYCRCIPQEYLNMSCRHLDLAGGDPGRALLSAILYSGRDVTLAIRGEHCFAPDYSAWQEADSAESLLEQEGVYIITGGLGLVGLGFAARLAKSYQARLILVGRLGGGEAGPLEVESQDERFADWNAAGAEVIVYRADTSCESEMIGLFGFTEETFGKIDGVIHAAGVVSSTPLIDDSPETRHATQVAKVAGALIIAEQLRDSELTFCLMVSSVSTVLGGIGYGAYASGNAVLDAIAHREDDGLGGTRWLSLGLDAVGAEPGSGEMSADAAAGWLDLVLSRADAPTQLVVSLTNLEQRLNDWVYGNNQVLDSSGVARVTHAAALPAKDRGASEHEMQCIWQRVLKLDNVGPEDDFFELGGDSVMAIPLFHEIREIFGVSLPIASLFKAPTSRQLVAQIGSLGKSVEVKVMANNSSKDHGHTVAVPFANGSCPPPISGLANSLVLMRQGDAAKPPIFFTHPGGGSIVFYHNMVHAMNHGHSMYGIESPLLSQSTLDISGMESIEAIAEKYLALMLHERPEGPYILAGYSFGGLVSLEMARQLLRMGIDHTLLVFDTPNPQAEFRQRNLGERLAYRWSKGSGVGKRLKMISQRAVTGLFERAQTESMLSKARTLNEQRTPSKSAKILNFQILELYDALTEAYHPEPFDGTMHLFVADDPGDKFCYDETLGWEGVICGNLNVTRIPGAHLTLFEEENLDYLSKAIEEHLHPGNDSLGQTQADQLV